MHRVARAHHDMSAPTHRPNNNTRYCVIGNIPETRNAPISVAIVGVGRGDPADDPEADVAARARDGHVYVDTDVRGHELSPEEALEYFRGFSRMRGLDHDLKDRSGKPVHLSVGWPSKRTARRNIINFVPLHAFLDIVARKRNLMDALGTSSEDGVRLVNESNVQKVMQFDRVARDLVEELLEEVPGQGEEFIATQSEALRVGASCQ